MAEQKQEFTRYEQTRILGARALQIAMNAPILLKIDEEGLEKLKYNPLKIAELEFNSGVLPITVKRPLPKKIHTTLNKSVKTKKEEGEKKEDKEIEKLEENEEEKIEKEGEIMELAIPEDEREEDNSDEIIEKEI